MDAITILLMPLAGVPYPVLLQAAAHLYELFRQIVLHRRERPADDGNTV